MPELNHGLIVVPHLGQDDAQFLACLALLVQCPDLVGEHDAGLDGGQLGTQPSLDDPNETPATTTGSDGDDIVDVDDDDDDDDDDEDDDDVDDDDGGDGASELNPA